jgi:hypothetical protein
VIHQDLAGVVLILIALGAVLSGVFYALARESLGWVLIVAGGVALPGGAIVLTLAVKTANRSRRIR